MARKISRKNLFSGTDRPGEQDGLDPRYDRKADRPGGPRKGLQLAHQASQTIASVLAGECDDDVLRDLVVESVTLAPHSGRLLVTVSLNPSAPYVAPQVILERLLRVQGRLRSEVASAVTRRKAPDLLFQVNDLPR